MKITPIKTIDEVKKLYKFMVDRYNQETRENVLIPFPLSETYIEMMGQVEQKEKLQFKAMIGDDIAGFITTSDKDKNGSDIYIQAIVVSIKYLKVGVGKVLLKFIEQKIKKAGYKIVKIKEREGSNVFYMKSNYVPYLYIYSPNAEVAAKVKNNLLSGMEFVDEYEKDGKYVTKIDVLGEPVCKYKKYFSSLDDSISSEYIYEKNLTKRYSFTWKKSKKMI